MAEKSACEVPCEIHCEIPYDDTQDNIDRFLEDDTFISDIDDSYDRPLYDEYAADSYYSMIVTANSHKPEYWDDKQAVLKSIHSNVYFVSRFSDNLKNDECVIFAAINISGETFKYASEKLKGDKDFVLDAIKKTKNGNIFEFVSEDLRGDKEIGDAVLDSKHPLLIKYASDKLVKDEEFI